MNQPATRIGQATAIELSRAEAEVKAAVFVAQHSPRNVEVAVDEMRFACRQLALAEKAFFSYPRAGETVSGPSIHLARELALIWGNIQHGTMELSRDTDLGQSEILAYAWDLQRNSRSSQIFIAPHIRVRTNRFQDGRKLRRYRRRWIVERTNAWLFNFRRLVVRYERKFENFWAFIQLACALIDLRRLAGL